MLGGYRSLTAEVHQTQEYQRGVMGNPAMQLVRLSERICLKSVSGCDLFVGSRGVGLSLHVRQCSGLPSNADILLFSWFQSLVCKQ